MTRTRRFVMLGAAALGLAMTTATTASAAWPERPVAFIVPFPAGGGTDAFARPLAAQLDQQLGQRIIIDNRGGAGGTVGASAAARAAPDGYTFFIGAAHHTIAPALYPRLDYNIEKDFIPIGVIAQPPQVVVVNPKRVEAKTLEEFIAYAKANPNKLNYASAGNGTTHHLAGELFKLLTKAPLVHVPYRGAGPAMQDLVSGQVDVMFDGLGSSAAQISSGSLRALAVAAPMRSEAFPDVPTAKEAKLDNYEVATWYGIWAVKGTPEPVVSRMRDEIEKALKVPAIAEAWKRNGSTIPSMYGPEFGRFVSAEVVRWGKVVSDANIRLE